MDAANCTLSMLVARPDLPFLMPMMAHRHRMLNTRFAERIIVMDTAPLSGNYARLKLGSLDELRARCRELCQEGFADRVLEINYDDKRQREIFNSQYSRAPRQMRDHRGCPLLGPALAIAEARTDYLAHFDSDILLYQAQGNDWISEGIDLLRKNEDLLFVAPLSGPPSADGKLKQRGVPHEIDPGGFYRFKNFTSRKFLVDRRRYEKFLPLDACYTSWKRRAVSAFTGKSEVLPWEVMVLRKLTGSRYSRADLASPQAWTLHAGSRAEKFYKALPEIIGKVERGWYPPEQAGDYDLQLEAWLQ